MRDLRWDNLKSGNGDELGGEANTRKCYAGEVLVRSGTVLATLSFICTVTTGSITCEKVLLARVSLSQHSSSCQRSPVLHVTYERQL